MPYNYNIKPFIKLGRRLAEGIPPEIVVMVVKENPWFTERSIAMAVDAICVQMLDEGKIEEWLAGHADVGKYAFAEWGECFQPLAGLLKIPPPTLGGRDHKDERTREGRELRRAPKRVGVIMAGNIPLVGFADMMYVLVSGNRCVVKPSSKDRVLMEYVIGLLREADAGILIESMTDESLLDAVIASGSDETKEIMWKRYGALPSILRGSRMSVAVIAGDESQKELEGLAQDIFSYCGLGCRNVSTIYVPRGYDIRALGAVLALSYPAIDNPRYINEYRQNKALNTMQGREFYDGGFFTLTCGDGGVGAVRGATGVARARAAKLSDIVYVHYDDISEAWLGIAEADERIQCVVAHAGSHPRRVGFGMAQRPRLEDYPDEVDVIKFLQSL